MFTLPSRKDLHGVLGFLLGFFFLFFFPFDTNCPQHRGLLNSFKVIESAYFPNKLNNYNVYFQIDKYNSKYDCDT